MRRALNTFAGALGKGLVAGFAGTAAMTVSSTLEAKLRGRAPSSAPARATAKMLGKSDQNILREGAPWFAPRVALDYMARHAIDFWLTTEDLPHPDNRVTVDRQGTIHLAKTTSFFPSSSAVNPALTAIANSLRVGDHLLERLGARAAVTEVST